MSQDESATVVAARAISDSTRIAMSQDVTRRMECEFHGNSMHGDSSESRSVTLLRKLLVR